MFKILCDNTTICNSQIENSAIINPVITEQANTCGTFSFTLPPTHSHYDDFNQRQSIVEVYEDDELTFRGICTAISIDFWKQKTITCEGELTYLNDSIQRPARYRGQYPQGYLETLINIHNSQVESYKQFTVGNVTVTDETRTFFRYTNYQSTMQEIAEDLIDNYGGYLRVRRQNGVNYLDYLQESIEASGQAIQLGVNMLDYKSNLDSLELCTRIIPLGATLDTQTVTGIDDKLTIKSVNDGLDYIDSDNINSYGVITKVVTWDDVTKASYLLKKAKEYISEYQYMDAVIEVSAVDLSAIDSSYDAIRLLDNVRIISEYHGLDSNFVLTKRTHYLDDISKDKLTFGKTQKMSLSAKTISETRTLSKQIKSISKASILESALQSAKDKIAGASGGYVVIEDDETTGHPSRILVMDTADKNTARKVMQINQNGIGFSTTGIDGNFTSAWTIEGEFDAQWITAGVLQGIEIIAERGKVGGWDISSNSIHSDVTIGNTIYRTYLQKPSATTDWSFSVQKSTNGGSSFTGLMYIRADGMVNLSKVSGDVNFYNTITVHDTATFNADTWLIDEYTYVKHGASATGGYSLKNYILAVVNGTL